jgi:UDP-galactopyranose mutase
MYDYLIIGSGLFGSIFAREMTDIGKKCLVIDKRSHIGGNCFTENVDSINIHKYGPHIFHTSDEKIWTWINKFATFNNYINRPKVNYRDNLYSFPINLFTLYQIFGIKTPQEAKDFLETKRKPTTNVTNLEDWIVSQVGWEIYDIFIKGYTTKQWGKHPSELPASIIRRLPIRLTFDDNYYTDKYQGIPIGGYTQIFEKLLSGIEVRLNTNYFENKDYFKSIAKKIVYTGAPDLWFSYQFGKLEWRSLSFETQHLEIPDYQGNAIINFTEEKIPYTRVVEHKHFEFLEGKTTIITHEYPQSSGEPYYPINDIKNNQRFSEYKSLMDKENEVIFGGRLADYKYYDMHQVIASALKKASEEKIKINNEEL